MSNEEDRETWTPSTEQVRAHYVFNQSDQWVPERGKAFDRWLASVRTPAPAPADSPPVYLALDLWMALGMPSNGFDGYYERNGWADTWANLLDAVRRQSGHKECPIVADGEGCVLINGHIGPHMGVSDVGSSEPLPLVGAAVSTPQVTDEMVESGGRALYENRVADIDSDYERAQWPSWVGLNAGDANEWRTAARVALEAALGVSE